MTKSSVGLVKMFTVTIDELGDVYVNAANGVIPTHEQWEQIKRRLGLFYEVTPSEVIERHNDLCRSAVLAAWGKQQTTKQDNGGG